MTLWTIWLGVLIWLHRKKNTDNADCYIMGDFSTFTELGKIAKKYKKDTLLFPQRPVWRGYV